MHCFEKSYFPNKIYFDLNFDEVKKEVKDNLNEVKDFGSIIYSNTNDFSISINQYGKLKIHSNQPDLNQISEIINFVENLFKKQNKTFSFKKDELVH